MIAKMMSKNKRNGSVNLKGLKFTTTSYGTVVRDTTGKVLGVFPTEDEAYEIMKELSEEERKKPE